MRPTRGLNERAAHPLLGLAPDGVCLAATVAGCAGELLPHPFTLTSVLPPKVETFGARAETHRWDSIEAVCSLLHYPRVAPPGTFPSVLPYGARTFLCSRAR